MSDQEHEAPPLPGGSGAPIDFMTFVLSMSTSCMIQLGEIAGPDGEKTVQLEEARQSIEILEMLERKTAGNLDGAEDRALSHVIEDLRARYIAAWKKARP